MPSTSENLCGWLWELPGGNLITDTLGLTYSAGVKVWAILYKVLIAILISTIMTGGNVDVSEPFVRVNFSFNQ